MPDEAAGEAQEDRLPEVEREDLARAHPQALEDRDGVQPAGEPGAHALGDADAAHEEREQGDEPEEALDPGDVLPQRRLRLPVGLDAEALAARGGPASAARRRRRARAFEMPVRAA